MTNQNKSAQARQRRRSSDGRFADEDKQDSLPSDTKIQQVASLLTDDTEPDFNQLLTATGAFDDPYEARHIEFDMPDGSTLNGYALDDGRIDRNKVPAGWHAYSVMESDGDRAWFTLLAVTLATLIPFVEGKDGDRVGFMMGDTSNGFNINITSPEFLACCRSMWVGADVHRGFGRYLNLRWDVGRREWVEAGSGFAFVGADSQVAFMLETAMSKGDGIRFDPMEGREETVRLFRLLLETAKCADIPVRFAGGSGGLRHGD